MGTLSEYSCVLLHLYPATRILIVFLSGHDEMCSDDFCINKQLAPSSPLPVMNIDPLQLTLQYSCDLLDPKVMGYNLNNTGDGKGVRKLA